VQSCRARDFGGVDDRFDDELIPGSFEWTRRNVVRRPGFLGPELTPPGTRGEQTRLPVFHGRAGWQPVPA
jgi:hypothetical protein